MADKGNNHHGNSSDVVPMGASFREKPKSFIEAVSKIQEWYVMEKDGSPVPKEFFTLKGSIEFWSVGFKGAFVSGLVSIIMTPFFIGVIQKHIPVFGTTNLSMFDAGFALALTLCFTLGYSCMVGFLGKYYVGEITKTAIKQLLMGFTTAGIGKMFLAVIFYNFIYIVVLEPNTLARALLKLYPAVSYDFLNKTYMAVLDFKPVFVTSQVFVLITTLFLVTIPAGCILYFSRKTRKRLEREKKWK